MITINGLTYPNILMAEGEMRRSLRVTAKYLKCLEEVGLPFIVTDNTHIYEPNAVWKWYTEYRRKG